MFSCTTCVHRRFRWIIIWKNCKWRRFSSIYGDHLSVKLRLAGILSNNKYIYIATTFYPIAVTLHVAFCHYCWEDCHHSLVYYHSYWYYHLQVSSHSRCYHSSVFYHSRFHVHLLWCYHSLGFYRSRGCCNG